MSLEADRHDLAIIGAGPAGMAAAAKAKALGLDTVVIDEQHEPGGQIYRGIGSAPLADRKILGDDYYHGRKLHDAMLRCGVEYLPGTSVWDVEPDLTLNLSRQGRSERIRARRLLITTGAQERPVPFPGWTLPGVITCGAAQILLKTSAVAPATPLVIAGSGPLMLLIATQLSRAGVPIAGVLDTTPRQNYGHALRHLSGALRNPKLIFKGLGLLSEIKRAGIPFFTGVESIAAESGEDERLAGVYYKQQKGQYRHIDCKSLLVHQGVVPNVQLTRALELDHEWNKQQQCWQPRLDAWGEATRPGIFVGGDSSGIAGAQAAEQGGSLAVLQVAHQLGRIGESERNAQSRVIRKALAPHLAIRPFLDVLYQPARAFLVPEDDTIVCRCEEVTAGELRHIADAGCQGPNQAKAFCRAGMGPCQGRLCGLTVSQVLADRSGQPMDAVGYYHIRPPIKPLTLGELADIAE